MKGNGFGASRTLLSCPSLAPDLPHLSPAVGSAAAHDLLVRVRARTRPAGHRMGEGPWSVAPHHLDLLTPKLR